MQEQTTTVPPSVLSHKSFSLFLVGRTMSVFAYQMTMVALAWQLYEMTDSAFALGLIGLAQFIPLVVFTLPVGYVSDRYDRRKVLRACQWIAALTTLVLTAGSFAGWINPYFIYASVVILGSVRAFELPTMGPMVPNLVPADDVPRAMAWFTSAQKTATIVGPALGGFLLLAGAEFVYGVSTAFWLCSGLLVLFVVMERPVRPKEPVTVKSLLAGFTFLLRDRVILGTATLDMFAVLIGSITILLPIFARDILQTGPWGLGLLRSSPAVGALAMSLVLARYPLKPPIGPILLGVTVLFGIATIAFALSTNFIFSMAALMVLGASDVVSVVIRFSIVQLRTPDDMRGRVSAANALFIGTSNQMGDFRSGVVAAALGAVPAALIGGIGTVAIAVVWMLVLFPELYRIYKLESDERPEEKPKSG